MIGDHQRPEFLPSDLKSEAKLFEMQFLEGCCAAALQSGGDLFGARRSGNDSEGFRKHCLSSGYSQPSSSIWLSDAEAGAMLLIS
jgi:hypothetical protein